MDSDALIVGGGLSGLAIADRLTQAGNRVILLEARDRPGGRVLSQSHGAHAYDLGPAWIWPQNRRMRALVGRLGLTLFEQHDAGNLVFEDPGGTIRRDLAFAAMGGALRVVGGLGQITNRLATALPRESLRLSHRATQLTAEPRAVRIAGTMPDGPFECRARRVILALPPRVLAARVRFGPPLHPALFDVLSHVPTWMAGQAKLVAIYDQPFWRTAGLSGDAISHRGPLVEIHDASPADASAGALFGFIDPAQTGTGAEAIRRACVAQLIQLFGPAASTPGAVLLKDWAQDTETATPADRTAPAGHPTYQSIPPLEGAWCGRVLFAGTEAAATEGGFLEGALEAAEACVVALTGKAEAVGP